MRKIETIKCSDTVEQSDFLSEMEMINIYGGDYGDPSNGSCGSSNGACGGNGECMQNGTCNGNSGCRSNSACSANGNCNTNSHCITFGNCSYGYDNGNGGGGSNHETIKPNEKEVHRNC